MEKLLLAMLGSCNVPKRSHSGLEVKCHIDELEGSRWCGLIDSLHRATWNGSGAVLPGEDRVLGIYKP